MKRIINSDPSPYPKTSSAELKAVNTLLNLFNSDRIKPDIKVLDKNPNTDGIVDIVTVSQSSIGKLEVQIKFLNKKNYSTPKYQCQKDFLAYCEVSILPVLLIIVDTKNSIAYWHYMNKSTITGLSKKIKKKTVNLNFDIVNSISKETDHYIDRWIEIIEATKTKLDDYDSIKERSEELQSQLDSIKDVPNIIIGKADPAYKEIHVFLDFYNNLLDNDFLTIKNRLYPDNWKIGLGIYEYLDHFVHFTLYPIPYTVNDVLIKQYAREDSNFIQNVLRYIGHMDSNPIRTRPKQYAFELLEKDILKVLKRPFWVKDQFIANEYILAFIDKFYLILGLEIKSDYYLSDIEFALNIFLPLWIERTIDKSEYIGKKVSHLFVLDNIYFQTYTEDIKRQSEKVKANLQEGTRPEINSKISSTTFNIYIFLELLAFLKSIGIDRITREYEVKNEINKNRYYLWEEWGEEKTVKNIKVFYNHFTRIYDLFIRAYFPNLKLICNFMTCLIC